MSREIVRPEERGDKTDSEASESPPRVQDARQYYFGDFVVYLGFIVILIFFAFILRDSGFMSVSNFMSIVRTTTPITVMAVGTVFVLSVGEIDLSIGSTVALASLAVAIALRETDSIALAILAGLGTGIAIGTFNGMAAVKLRIPSFLVTLGTLSLVAGLARAVTELDAIPIINTSYNFWFGSGSFGPVSILFVWSALAVIIGHFVLHHIRFGRRILSTGGNEEAAMSLGINTGRIKIYALIISAVTAAIAGMLYAGRLHGARYTLGEADLLTVLAAVVIGGTSLFGGKGSVIGALTGSIIMGMLNNGLVLMGLDVSEQMMARGIIIIVAVALSLREEKL